ncbi:MAG: hypothetical protein WEB05_05785 [Solirubrobacterales bacterium]
MRKGALKKKQRQLEELHLDRCEALGELILGMYVQGSWDEDTMSRGAAEVREVADELDGLKGPAEEPADSAEVDLPPPGEDTAEQSLPETGESARRRIVPDPETPETSEHTREHEVASGPVAAEPESKRSEPKKSRARKRPSGPPAEISDSKPPEVEVPKAATAKPQEASPVPAAKAEPAKPPAPPLPARPPVPPVPARPPVPPVPAAPPAAPARPPQPAPTSPAQAESEEAAAWQKKLDELDLLDGKIGKSVSEARTAAEAAKAAAAADSRTELSAIARELEANRTNLTSTLAAAGKRLNEAKKRADDAEAKMARESAASREAAAGWVRGQAAEIEADAALAAEIAASPADTTEVTDAAKLRQAELEARIGSLEASLEAEKASKIEALTMAESRLKAIEESAREAERRVEEAEDSLAEAGTAPVAVEAVSGIVTEAEAREAAVTWLRGQIAAMRKEIVKGGDTESQGGA